MKLGMNMLLWSTDVTGPEYLPVFEMLGDAGYDGIEVPIFGAADLGALRRLGEHLDGLGLVPLGVTACAQDDSPISADPAVRARTLEATKAAIDGCAALGARTLCGPIEAPLGVFSGTAPTDDERAHSVESLRAAAEYAASRDVTLVVEYLNRFEMYLVNCAADAAALVRAVDHPSCRLMYDTFHAHIEEKDPRAALRECADVLVYVHASENDRGTPGEGQVAWETTFSTLHELGYDGWIVIEAFGDALPDLSAATKIWRRMFSSEEQLARDGAAFIRKQWAASAAPAVV
jgi:D-psicose/D-tagatose/L-ribulose 3-epimerase